ncbi:coagulation factor XI-like [Boleophthalmus pectinirostris]|uniref:coagulation factor XI-like n=1 Tax=Boleophthalmus pectinirostris TaxID=150288 RepID=UPI0024313966|nr:coagulation factor XI-like [Boleophthalmus pectinirostris]
MRRFFVFVSLLCLCGHSSSQECHQELLENVDFPGTDIEFVYSPDVNHCQQMCTQHPSCLFFTFLRADWTRDNRHFYCYLKKTSSGQPSVQTPLLGVTSGYSLKPCPEHQAPCFDQTYSNLDFPGADYRVLFTTDYEECQRACTQDPGCQFFTWANSLFSNEKIRYKCHLKFSWTVPLTPIVEKKSGVVSGFSHNALIDTSQNFFKECQTKYFFNADIPGNDLLRMPAASPEHCQILCTTHPSCTYFSFESTTCYLKNNPNEMVTFVKAGVTSGLPSRFCQPDMNWLTVTHEGTDFRASDMRFVLLDNAESCQRACNDDSNCQFFTYVNENFFDSVYWGRCYLKRVINVPAPLKVTKLANVVSGFALRRCSSHTV